MKNDTDDHPEGQPFTALKKLFAFFLAEANHNSFISVQPYCTTNCVAPKQPRL